MFGDSGHLLTMRGAGPSQQLLRIYDIATPRGRLEDATPLRYITSEWQCVASRSLLDAKVALVSATVR